MADQGKGLIPEAVIEEILARNSIEDVVSEYVSLIKSSGQNKFGLCPFHGEDTPSFSISTNKQIFYCFGCHKGGNSVNFIMEIEKCSYYEALKFLATKANITIPAPNDHKYQKQAKQKEKVMDILLEAARYYYKNLSLPPGNGAMEYLKKRQISSKTAKTFGLGYAPHQWQGLYNHIHSQGFSEEDMSHSGLFSKTKNAGWVDLFRNRLMFPIFDSFGKIIAFGGRSLDDTMPKYINSPESLVYSKQKHLYGLNFAKASKAKNLIVVEGYMDVIAIHQAGFSNVVASLGTALTEKQLDLLSKYTEDIILFYDSDKAGEAAALRGLEMILNRQKKITAQKTRIQIGVLPDGKDPDEFIKLHGAGAFHDQLFHSLTVIDFLLLVAQKQSTVNGALDLTLYQQKICSYLAWETNAILREKAARKAAEILHVKPDSILLEVDKYIENQKKSKKPYQSGLQSLTASAHLSSDSTTYGKSPASFAPLENNSDHNLTAVPLPNPSPSPINNNSQSIQPTLQNNFQAQISTAQLKDFQEQLSLLLLLADMENDYNHLKDKPHKSDFSFLILKNIFQEIEPILMRRGLNQAYFLNIIENYRVNNTPLPEIVTALFMKEKTLIPNPQREPKILDSLYRLRLKNLKTAKEQIILKMEQLSNPADKKLAQQQVLNLTGEMKNLREKLKQVDKT